MRLRASGFLRHHRHRRFQIVNAAGYVGIVSGTPGVAVPVMVHGPHVIAIAGKHIHERIFALAGHRQIEARACGIGRAMYQE